MDTDTSKITQLMKMDLGFRWARAVWLQTVTSKEEIKLEKPMDAAFPAAYPGVQG